MKKLLLITIVLASCQKKQVVVLDDISVTAKADAGVEMDGGNGK